MEVVSAPLNHPLHGQRFLNLEKTWHWSQNPRRLHVAFAKKKCQCYAQEPCGEAAGLCKTQECAGQPRHVQLQRILRAKCLHVSEHMLAKAIERRCFIHDLKVAEGYLSQCEQQAYEVKQLRTSLLV